MQRSRDQTTHSVLATGLITAEKANLVKYGMARTNAADVAKHKYREKYPAFGAECRRCHKKGHWERMCKTKLVHEVMREDRDSDSFFLGSVQHPGEGRTETSVTVNITIGNTPVVFKIDTRADVTIINKQTFQNLQKKHELCKANVILNTPGGQLTCVGQFRSHIKHKAKLYELTIYVVKGPTVNNLLSGRAAKEMGLVK